MYIYTLIILYIYYILSILYIIIIYYTSIPFVLAAWSSSLLPIKSSCFRCVHFLFLSETVESFRSSPSKNMFSPWDFYVSGSNPHVMLLKKTWLNPDVVTFLVAWIHDSWVESTFLLSKSPCRKYFSWLNLYTSTCFFIFFANNIHLNIFSPHLVITWLIPMISLLYPHIPIITRIFVALTYNGDMGI